MLQLGPLKDPLPRIFFQSTEFRGGSSGILPEPAPDQVQPRIKIRSAGLCIRQGALRRERLSGRDTSSRMLQASHVHALVWCGKTSGHMEASTQQPMRPNLIGTDTLASHNTLRASV